MAARTDWGAEAGAAWPDLWATDRALSALDAWNLAHPDRDTTTIGLEQAARAAFLADTAPENRPQDVSAMDLEDIYRATHRFHLWRGVRDRAGRQGG